MSNDNAGRTSRTTTGGAPMGSTVAIVVTAIALVLGFLILRKVNDDDTSTTTGGDGGGDTELTTTSLDATVTTAAAVTSTTLVKTGTGVQVANCSGQGGMAGQMTTALQGAGFTTVDPTNCANGAEVNPSKVIYDAAVPSAQAVAESLAIVLGGIAAEVAPTPNPVESAAFATGSGVILLLGDDLAGKTLDQINQVPESGTTVPTTTPTGVTTTG